MAFARETFDWERGFEPLYRGLEGEDPTGDDPLSLFDDSEEPFLQMSYLSKGQLGGDEIEFRREAAEGEPEPAPMRIILPRTSNRGDNEADRWAADRGLTFDGSRGLGGVIDFARTALGKPYVWAAEDPKIGFDCSGLVYWAFNRAGFNLPRTTARGYQNVFRYVSRDELQAGDVVYFSYGRLGRNVVDHIGIYVGDGMMIDASSSEGRIVHRQVDWDNLTGGGRLKGGGKPAAPMVAAPGVKKPKRRRPQEQGDGGLSTAVLGLADEIANTLPGSILEPPRQPMPMTRPTQSAEPSRGLEGGSVEQNLKLGEAMAAEFGWTGQQWNALKKLWMRESGWRTNAANPSSSARGIPQAMMSVHFGTGWQNSSQAAAYLRDPRTQILWGLNYIQERYGSPTAALTHSDNNHWY